MDRLKVAVVGYGGMGKYHAECFSAAPFAEVAGVLDIDPAACRKAERDGYSVYPDFETIAGDSEVNTVLIATPNDCHLPYVRLAAAAKKNMICEKPAALNDAEAAEMMAIAEAGGVCLMVHQNRRWDGDYLSVQEILRRGLIGGVYRIQSRVMGSHGIPGDWRKVREKGGGMMLDWGVHLVDQMMQLVPGKVTSVFCDCSYVYGLPVDDGFSLTLWFSGGISAEIIVDTNSFIPLPRWELYGTEGSCEIEDWSGKGRVVSVETREDADLAGVRAGNGFTKTMAARSGDTVTVSDVPKIDVPEFPFYSAFLNYAQGGKPVITSGEILRVFSVMEAAMRSSNEHMILKGEW